MEMEDPDAPIIVEAVSSEEVADVAAYVHRIADERGVRVRT
jgi:hypothetical protein